MRGFLRWLMPIPFTILTCWLLIRFLRQEEGWGGLMPFFTSPGWIMPVAVLYTASFLLKAWAWRVYTSGALSWSLSVQGLYASLFVNHVLPVKAGDLVRAGLAAREPRLGWDGALHSVGALRSLDLLTLGTLAAAGTLLYGVSGAAEGYLRLLAAVAIAVCAAAAVLLLGRRTAVGGFVGKHLTMVRSILAGRRGAGVLVLTAASWILEGSVLYSAARVMGVELSITAAVWVTAMTVAGQVFHFTPGGIGTYESFMTGSLAAVGVPLETAFAVAVATHGFKFIYSYAAGGLLLWRAAVTWRQMKEWTRLKGTIRFRTSR